jgi:flavin-dependent dehydrogenase
MHDIIVIGGGPAGSTAATFLARKGYSVVLLERERFPRFQIGESLLPYNNDLFARLGVADQLTGGEFHPKYGAHFVTADGGVEYTFRFDRNLPAGYQNSFQVRRSEFDHLLLKNAAANGVTVREQTAVTSVGLDDPDGAWVQTSTGERLEAKFIVDASGHGSVLGQRVGEKSDVRELRKIAFFSHYKGVPLQPGRDAGNTSIVVLKDAWFWMIPVTTEIMSVGVVVDREHVMQCGLTGEELLDQTIAATPYVAELMKNAERLTPVHARKDFSFRMKNLVGKNFALIGDAAGFLDPIFSTGVFMAMKSGDITADAIDSRLRTGSMSLLKKYESDMTAALDRYFRFIENFYRREFLEVFLQPKEDFGLIRAIVEVLAGNIFNRKRDRLKLALFFSLVKLQKWTGAIAVPINWDALPVAAAAPSASSGERELASAV